MLGTDMWPCGGLFNLPTTRAKPSNWLRFPSLHSLSRDSGQFPEKGNLQAQVMMYISMVAVPGPSTTKDSKSDSC